MTSIAPPATLPLVEKLATQLLQRQWMQATAESCTGGLIAGACTDVSGSSTWFERGFVTYSNAAKSELLEEIRKSMEPNIRAEKLNLLQNILIKDSPAVFLYCPDYLYFVSKKINGINIESVANPSKRFSTIENWYIKTRRGWK